MNQAAEERAFNLLAYLLASREPRDVDEIVNEVAGYDGSDEARRRSFERDKVRLREMGIRVVADEDGLYSVDRETAFLPALDLRPADALLLSLVVQLSLVRADGADDPDAVPLRSALAKLFAAYPALPPLADRFPVRPYRATSVESLSPVARTLAAAVSERRSLRVRYRPAQRRPASRVLDPYGLFRHDGAAYLVAHDHGRDAIRTFKVARLAGVADATSSPPPHFERPPAFRLDRYARRRPWDLSDADPVAVEVTFEDAEAGWVLENWEPAGEVAVEQGGARLRTHVRDVSAFGRFLLRFARFRVQRPDALRSYVAERARAAISRHSSPPEGAQRLVAAVRAEAERRGHGRRSPVAPPDGWARLQRLTALLPYVLARQGRAGVPLADLARQFGISTADAEREVEWLTLCGLPDYGPDRLIFWDPYAREAGRVRLDMAEFLRRPLRLHADEAAALVTAVQRARTLLGRAFPRAFEALSRRLSDALPPDWLPAGGTPAATARAAAKWRILFRAAQRRSAVAFEYLKLESGRRERRRVVPMLLRDSGDDWHLFGADLDRGGGRSFRLSCIRDLRPAPGALPAGAPTAAERDDDVGAAVVRADASTAEWVRERLLPVATKAVDGGGLIASVPSYSADWLAARILPSGDGVEVLEPPAAREAVAARARDVLSRNV